MLTIDEIKKLIDNDRTSTKKILAKKGKDYYEALHDIRHYRIFYYNADGELVEDTTRSNAKIAHPFFTELVDQEVQYILSSEKFIRSDDPQLQKEMDKYFNEDEDFISELSETLTDTISCGFGYMYAYKNRKNRTAFTNAECMGVVEVRAKDTEDQCEYVIYWYVERIEKGNKLIKRIQVWDEKQVSYYCQIDNGAVTKDETEKINPKPHILYKIEGDETNTYYETYGFIPFFRLDNNKKQISGLKPIKDLIDDYDMMSCGLSNNLADFDNPIYVVKGFEGDNLDQLQQNIKTKKMIGMEAADAGAGVDIRTIDVPYEARKVKLELDEKNIYRFGMGLNTASLKDTSATTNIAIKAAYSLLELKCTKLVIRLKQFLRKLIEVVINEINAEEGTDYSQESVYFQFKAEIMSNALENAQIELTKAQTKAQVINILLSLAEKLDNETIMKYICEELEIDYEEIKDKLPDPDEAEQAYKQAQSTLDGVVVDE